MLLKKPLFWILLIIILAIAWFIFIGRHQHNQSEQTTSSKNTSIKLPLSNPDMPVIVKNKHPSKESIAKQTVIAEHETLNLDNNHAMTPPVSNQPEELSVNAGEINNDMKSNTTPVAEPQNQPPPPQDSQSKTDDPFDPFEEPATPSEPLRQQPGPIDKPHSEDPFQDTAPKTEQNPFQEENSPINNNSSGKNQNAASPQPAQSSASSPNEPGQFNHP